MGNVHVRAMRPDGYDVNAQAFADTYVFHTRLGKPLDNTRFIYRVWRLLLDRLGIVYRRPYEMRHICATAMHGGLTAHRQMEDAT